MADETTPAQSRYDSRRLAHLRAAIVTGSSSGIGRAVALAFADLGVGLVVCADIKSAPESADWAAWEATPEDRSYATHQLIEMRHGSGRAIFARCDVSIEHAETSHASKEMEVEIENKKWGMANVVEETVRRAGRLDV